MAADDARRSPRVHAAWLVTRGGRTVGSGSRVSDPERVTHALAELFRADVAVTEFALGQPSLDEAFLALTGHPPDDHEMEDAA